MFEPGAFPAICDEMTLAARFTDAVAAAAAEDDDGDALHLLPERLARAAVRVLPVDGAGISVHAGAAGRTPLGASSPVAALAERLQFTTDQGPCMQAHADRQPVFVVEDDIRRRWPAFADLLVSRTPFRGVVALPLRSPLAGAGAMDLFFRDPADVPRLDVFDAVTVGDLVGSALGEAAVLSTWSESAGPDWLRSPSALSRAAVWDAVGRISLTADVDAPSALELLRGYASADGRSVDAIAADLVSGRLELDAVRGRR